MTAKSKDQASNQDGRLLLACETGQTSYITTAAKINLTSIEEESLVQWVISMDEREVSLLELKTYEIWWIYYFLPELILLWENNGFKDSLHVRRN
ncbi:hypothetical protein ACO22_04416 [Paracoccidioides brasiliensis]|uniref:Uncharacterized protein n=1 Tax=Paracoccidioides brasiliensis TaxID=121759 RepID=A0A1D2JD67_PARBR|nr:hypothetical protein ACO22_04416 [Paracoccidioides brasiliensis]